MGPLFVIGVLNQHLQLLIPVPLSCLVSIQFWLDISQLSLIEKNEMGGACGSCGGGERCAQGSGGET